MKIERRNKGWCHQNKGEISRTKALERGFGSVTGDLTTLTAEIALSKGKC